jgi:hypothetical protein
MTPTMKNTLKNLNVEELKTLARHSGPCVTIQVPGYQPGAGGGSRLAYLRQLTQAGTDGLRKIDRPEEADQLAAALDNLIKTLPVEHGGPGMTLFCTPGFEAAYNTPAVRTEQVTVASRFHLVPHLAAARAPQDFYVLGISRKNLRLFHYTYGNCEELPLPASVPASLDAAGAFDKPDHTQESRSSGGPSVGAMRGVRFGTSSDHDSEGEYLRHFFETVDKGLKETLKGAPLFLAGVQNEVNLYRKVAKHAHLFESELPGNVEHFSTDQMAQHASAAAMNESQQASRRAVEPLSEIPNKIAGDPEEVLKAAKDGRVHQIFVAEEARMARAHVAGIYLGEDMINAAVVEGLRTGAEVFAMPGKEIAGAGPIAAVLRY